MIAAGAPILIVGACAAFMQWLRFVASLFLRPYPDFIVIDARFRLHLHACTGSLVGMSQSPVLARSLTLSPFCGSGTGWPQARRGEG